MTIKYLDSKRISLLKADRTLYQGYDGGSGLLTGAYSGGGGGGSSSAGGNATTSASGTGGTSTNSSITGSAVAYAGGGSGGSYSDPVGSAGGAGAGLGALSASGSSSASGENATIANRGSGGGGGGWNGSSGTGAGNGSDGIVILRFTTSGNGYSQAGGTVDSSTVSGQTIISWTATSGTRTFTPTSAFDVQYLVVAGGAGGGDRVSGGGGAGGLLQGTGFGVTAQAYTITVGAKGTGGSSNNGGSNGGNSVFSTITSIGGGAGAGWATTTGGSNGGSGGGGMDGESSRTTIGGTGTSSDVPLPTNVQDNSILVEKDTGNRYWRTPESTSDVTWDDSTDVGCSISGNTVTKTSGNSWTSGVAKTDEVISASSGGTITMTSNAINTYIGLSNVATLNQQAKHWYDVKLGFNQNSVIENGAIVSPDTAFTRVTSDTMKITVSSAGLVKYYINDVLKHTSTITASGTYFGIFSAYNTNETLTATITTSATWTMEPTFEDDFSTSTGWSTATSNLNISSNRFNWSIPSGTTSSQVVRRDMGLIHPSKWVLRCMWEPTSATANSDGTSLLLNIGFSDSAVALTAVQDSITWQMDTSSSTVRMGINNIAGNAIYHGSIPVLDASITAKKYYIELSRDGDVMTGKSFTDAGFSVQNGVTQTKAIASGISDLRYLIITEWESDGSTNGAFAGIIDNIEFYNGVTSIN